MIEVLAIVFGAIGAFAAFVILHARPRLAYIFPSATVSAWEAKLLPEARLMELADAPSVAQIFAALEDTEYRKQLAEVQVEGVETAGVENALKINSNARYSELLDMVPKERKEMIEKLLQRTDVWNLKAIVTAIHNGAPVDERIRQLMPSPTTSRERLEMLASAESFEQLLEYLKGTEYFPVLSDALKGYPERGLAILLAALDLHHYRSLWEEVLRVKAQRSTLMPLIGYEIDVVNLKLIFRLKLEGAKPEEITGLLIRPSYALTEEMLRAMAMAEDIHSAADVISQTTYGKILFEILPQVETQGLYVLERALDEALLKFSRWLASAQFFSIAPAVAYIRLKETEAKNLHAIIKLKADGVDPRMIKELLVGVPKIGS